PRPPDGLRPTPARRADARPLPRRAVPIPPAEALAAPDGPPRRLVGVLLRRDLPGRLGQARPGGPAGRVRLRPVLARGQQPTPAGRPRVEPVTYDRPFRSRVCRRYD